MFGGDGKIEIEAKIGLILTGFPADDKRAAPKVDRRAGVGEIDGNF